MKYLTPSLTALRRKNALHAMHDRTPKLKPMDLSPQTRHGSSSRAIDAVMRDWICSRERENY